jgi:membrane protease YdiL (CAAX protease family)
MTTARRIVILIGLALALVVPLVGPTRYLPPVAGTDPLYVHEWFWWALWAVVMLYVLVVERRPLSSIGFKRPTWKTLVYGIGGGLIAAFGIGAIFALLFPVLGLHMNREAFNTLYQTPFWFRVALVTRAAVVEETLFRGYGIERTQELTGNRWIAAILTWAAFTFAHLSHWGWAHLMVAGGAAVILTALYLWRRDLICNILAHWTTDAVGLLLPHP